MRDPRTEGFPRQQRNAKGETKKHALRRNIPDDDAMKRAVCSGRRRCEAPVRRFACGVSNLPGKKHRPEKRFADAVKGLDVYGVKVVRPTAVIVGTVSF